MLTVKDTNTEDRHIIIKDGINNNHAVSKTQLDMLEQNIKNEIVSTMNTLETEISSMIQTAITTAINNLKTERPTIILEEVNNVIN